MKLRQNQYFYIIVLLILRQAVSFQYVKCFQKVIITMQPSFSRWNGFDAPRPREVVCDASHALLITAV